MNPIKGPHGGVSGSPGGNTIVTKELSQDEGDSVGNLGEKAFNKARPTPGTNASGMPKAK